MDKEYLIRKWLINDLTEEEQVAFKQLDDYDDHVQIIEAAQSFKSNKIVEIADLDAFYSRVNKRSQSKNKWFTPYLKYAAMLVVMLGVGSLLFLNRNKVSTTGIAEKTFLELPDASEVVLNSKSEIAYAKNNWKNNREVTLSGEAFFKVEKGSTFDVITNSGVVSVLGTQFNVKNRKEYFEVRCFEGLVKVKYNQSEKKLPAGHTLRIANGIVTFSEINNDKEPNWIHDVSTFKSVAYDQVIKEFERQYNVVFSTVNVDTSRIFTGGFVHTNLEDGLKSITLPLDLAYKIESENKITLSKKNP